MLRRGLQERGVAVTVFGNVNGELNLSRLLFAGPVGAYDDGVVYLIEQDAPPAPAPPAQDGGGPAHKAPAEKKPPREGKIRSVAVISGAYDVDFIRRFEAVFIAEEAPPLTRLHNDIQSVFEKYDLWSNDLRHLLDTGSDVQGMIDIATRVLENPLVLQDSNFNVIAVSGEYAGNPKLEPILDQNNVPYMMMSARGAGARGSVAGSPEATGNVVPLQIVGRHALYTNIFQQGRFQYRLLVLEMNNELHASAATLLEFVSGYIQLAIGFVVDDAAEAAALPFFLKSILSGEVRDEGFIEQRLLEFGWKAEHQLLCARIRAELPDYKNRTMRFMSDRLTAIFPEACIFEYENSIAAFFNLSLAEPAPGGGKDAPDLAAAEKGVRSALTGFLQDNNMKAGLSNAFKGFGYLREYYTQAGVAGALGPRVKPYQWLHKFSDVKEIYILERCSSELPPRMICDPGLLRLRAYDEERGQELYHTLYVYLKNNLRAVSAAKELYIHRSTFLYRLDRIREITGMRFESDADQWYLLLSYKLLEQER
jgi:hypothetical protein